MSELGKATVRRSARAVIWALGSAASGKLLSLLAMTVLARILSPQEFGLVAFAMAFIVYLDAVGDLGTGMALIYWPDRRDDAAQLTFWCNLATGALWFAVTFLGAHAVATFFRQPDGAAVLRALALTFLIRGLGNTHDALSRKDLDFKARLLPELGLVAVKAAVAVPLVVNGWGVWSLVVGQLAGESFWTVGMWWIQPWRPRFRFPFDLVRPMLRYGRGIVAVNVVASIVHHADIVVVGRMLGVAALGVYHVAFKLTEVTLQLPVWAVSRVAFPAFTCFREQAALDRAYLTTLRFVCLAIVPAAAGLAFLADPLVLVCLGEQWVRAGPVLRVLALYTLVKAIGTHAGDVLKSIGEPALLARLGVLRGVILVPALLLAGTVGVEAVAGAMTVVALPFSAIQIILACSRIGVRAERVVRAVAPAVLASIPMIAGLLGHRLIAGPIDDTAGLVGAVGLGGGCYLAALVAVSPDVFRDAWRGLGLPESTKGPAARPQHAGNAP